MNQTALRKKEKRARLTSERQLDILRDVLTVKPIRKIAQRAQCSNDAVTRFLKNAGEATAEYHILQRNLPVRRIVIDEYHVLVGGRDKRVSEYMRKTAGWGAYWVWLAICADTGFMIATHVGQRTLEDATFMMQKIRAKLPEDEYGRLPYKPSIVTDGYHGYWEAAERVFSAECNFAQYVKQYTAKRRGHEVSGVDKDGELKLGARFNGAKKENRIGFIPDAEINTSRVEGAISRFRRLLPRMNRRSPFNSKSVARLEDAISLAVFAFNYVMVREDKEPVFNEDGTPAYTKAGNPKMRTIYHPRLGLCFVFRSGPAPQYQRASFQRYGARRVSLSLRTITYFAGMLRASRNVRGEIDLRAVSILPPVRRPQRKPSNFMSCITAAITVPRCIEVIANTQREQPTK